MTGRAFQRLGKLLVGAPEDLRFCRFFGVSAEIVVEAWRMMEDHNCLSPNPKFLHYLWELAFMQTYPANNEAILRSLGGSDPKTIHKYIWPYINPVFELDENSGKLILVYHCLNEPLITFRFSPQQYIVFKNRNEGDVRTTVFCWWAQTSALKWAIESLFMTKNSKGAGTATRYVYASRREIFDGGMGLTSPVIGMTR